MREPTNELEDYEFTYPRHVKTTVHSIAKLFDDMYPHVLHLTVVPRPWDTLVRRLTSYLPIAAQTFIKARMPGPFLPPCVVVKKLQRRNESHESLFEDEKNMYQVLKPLQGTFIPNFYGEAICEGRRALIISVVDGVRLHEQPPSQPRIALDDLRARLEPVAAAFKSCGASYDDIKVDNLILVEGGVVLIDLEYAWVPGPEDGGVEKDCHRLPLKFVYRYNEYLRGVKDPNAINKDLTYDLFYKDRPPQPPQVKRPSSIESRS